MKIIADLHTHSKYSRATSFNLDLANLEKYARIKGVDLLGTADFQHPKWFPELNKLKEENGILWTETKFPFIWQTEISLMYTQEGKGRRIHFVILAPNKEVVKQIISALGKKGRLDYDGRPIFGFSAMELVDMMQSISNEIEIIPAHCMTPWFAIFGSKSGFDSVEECFKEKTKFIHAIETGMSADPPMLRKVSKFDKFNLVSFSDSHSFWPWRLGREATIFECDLNYKDILKAIRTGQGLKGTIETVPAYGRYHFDGHRECNISFDPKETIKHKGICPKCHRPLTIGVEYRIEQLADREKPKVDKEYKDLVPLHELIAAVYSTKLLASKKVWDVYNNLIKTFKNEFNILLNIDEEELKKIVPEKLSKVIILNRENKLKIKPGYDGVYGELIDVEKLEIKESKPQKSLTEF
jgi:uncharacterized protein (TIGR00375 family)